MPEIPIKNACQIEVMKKGGKIAALVLDNLAKNIRAGVTTAELDKIAKKLILKNGARCSFKGFGGYPACTCISVNNEVVHGIPSNKKLKNGDIVGVDVGIYLDGFHTDTAATFACGKISAPDQKLLKITKNSLTKAIKAIKPGVHLGDISSVIQKEIEKAGFGVVRDLTGHGVGAQLQEPPAIPNFGKAGVGAILKEGMTLAIEPMVTEGDWRIKIKDDGWTVVTADAKNAAHFEHSVAVTKTGAEVLTSFWIYDKIKLA